jgi:hypothetical protein
MMMMMMIMAVGMITYRNRKRRRWQIGVMVSCTPVSTVPLNISPEAEVSPQSKI